MQMSLTTSKKQEDEERQENLQELLSGIKTFVDDRRQAGEEGCGLEDYLMDVALLTDEDTSSKAVSRECVKMMTVHASKGLEFPVVFIVGMDEDIFPCRQAFDSPRTMEEERRLFYVAMTRAKDRCFLTGSDQRFRNGSIQPLMRSSFIGDIDRQYLKIIRI